MDKPQLIRLDNAQSSRLLICGYANGIENAELSFTTSERTSDSYTKNYTKDKYIHEIKHLSRLLHMRLESHWNYILYIWSWFHNLHWGRGWISIYIVQHFETPWKCKMSWLPYLAKNITKDEYIREIKGPSSSLMCDIEITLKLQILPSKVIS